MKTTTKQQEWCEASTGNHQGLIVEEGTGRNIAIAYDKKDAALIAAAPELLSALENLLDEMESRFDYEDADEGEQEAMDNARNIITKATGGQP